MDSSKEAIRTVFNTFDKDHSGFIDFNEVVSVAKELGQQFTVADIKKIFKDIDTNKDEKISFEEFYTWWQYGRDNKLETLVAIQLKALNLLSKAKNHFHKINSQVVGSSSDINTYTVKVAVGSPENTKTALNLKVLVGANQEEFASQVLKGLNLGTDVPAVIFRFKTENPVAGKEKLEELITSALEMAQAMIPDEGASQMLGLLKPSFGFDGDQVVFAISFEHPLIRSLLENYLEVLNLFLGNDARAELEADFGLNFDLNTIFDNKDKKVVDIVSKGFHFNAALRLSEQFREKYRKVLDTAYKLNEKSENAAIKFINKTAFIFLLRAFNLELITKDLEDLLVKSTGTVVYQMLGGAHEIGPTLEYLKGDIPPISVISADMPIIQDAVDYFKMLEGSGSFTVQIPRISLNLSWKTSGGAKLLDHFN